ncbi:hypothetical protein [Streptomonospora wellingtoniae]|uniref:Uncharacterized protein n=1 Tax=Streptomonospora wellingtoniae TaxID=3075544 RepID=A0ABU2KXV2_9ACTN|nr:hypothetical protein [Streptomonospora sp. DSM 45055]MDT0304134.1 hypothetical protein [Streptomonospora sp. DSM 45055]
MEGCSGGPDDTAVRRPRIGGRRARRRTGRFRTQTAGVSEQAAASYAGYRAYDATDGGFAALALVEEETPAQILLRGLVDDAGLCPPATTRRPDGALRAARGRIPGPGPYVPRGDSADSPDFRPLPVVQAVERHRSDSIVGHPMLSHRLLCPVARWGDLLRRLDGHGPVDVGLVLDADRGLAGEVPERDPRVRISHYETRARPEDLRLVAALFRTGDIGAAGRVVYFEPFREPGWLDAVDVLSGARPLGVKIRCGGPRPELVPGVRELGAFISSCVERGVPFVAAGGPPQAAGCTDPATGAPQYGYLNLLLATASAVDGDHGSVPGLLSTTDARCLARLARGLHPATALHTREVLTGYASRSTGDPVREAAALGLLGSWQV